MIDFFNYVRLFVTDVRLITFEKIDRNVIFRDHDHENDRIHGKKGRIFRSFRDWAVINYGLAS